MLVFYIAACLVWFVIIVVYFYIFLSFEHFSIECACLCNLNVEHFIVFTAVFWSITLIFMDVASFLVFFMIYNFSAMHFVYIINCFYCI